MALSGFFRSFNCASGHSKKKHNRLPVNESNTNSAGPSAPPAPNSAQATNDDEDDIVENDQSFYDIGAYKVVLKRCDNGAKLADDLSDLISERAKIEDNYGKSLKSWNTKWNQYLKSNSSEEYGKTMKGAWMAFGESGSKTADVHIELSKKLINQPVNKIKEWMKNNYQKSFINFKKTKEFDEKFQEAQKNWANLYTKMKKLEKDFKEAIADSVDSEKASQSAESNPKFTSEQRVKLKDKSIKDKEELAKAKKRYKESIVELDLYKPRYIENMDEVFKYTQNFERERMLFFKNMFIKCHELLQIQHDERYDELFKELEGKISNISPNDDLNWWANHYGPGNQADWPKFIDYEAQTSSNSSS